MKTIALGKYRGLTQTSTKNSAFSVLALDHRNNLRNALNPKNPSQVSDDDMINFKTDVVRALSPYASAVLLDPEIGSAQCIANGSLPGNRGLLCALEETGYTGDPLARESKILPGWDISKAKRLGASAIKLLVYYHPKSNTATEIEKLIEKVGIECEKAEIAFFLEPLSYSLIKGVKLSPVERKDVVIETARRLSVLGADILKAEFPADVTSDEDERSWSIACNELTSASVIPWVLLSASVDFDKYMRQVKIACDAGSSGVAAGRAVWKEAVITTESERSAFLTEVAAKRMQKLTEICDSQARPWKDFYTSPILNSTWYQFY
jgi:tagatose 1,6-diphosphate aldolase